MRKFTQILLLVTASALFGALTPGCSARARAQAHLQSGDKYFDAGQYSKAEVEYLNVLQLQALDAHAMARLGTIYYEQGRLDRALAFLAKASELSTNDMELQFKLGAIFLGLGKTNEARDKAILILEKTPTHPEAPLLLAESAIGQKPRAEAQQRLEKLSAQTGDTAPLQIAFGALRAHEGDFKAAEAALRRAVSLDPKSSAAHFELANLCWAQRDLKTAEVEFKAAADLAPLRSIRRSRYADFKIQTGDSEEGKRLLVQITKDAPDYLPSWVRQAEVALGEGKYDDCASLLQQVLSRDSANFDGLVLRGRLMLARGETANALAEFERLSKTPPFDRSPQVYYQLALAHLANNEDTSKVLPSLKEAIALDPRFDEAILLQAQINLARGDIAAAIAVLTEVLKRRPGLPQAQMVLASAYAAKGDLDAALASYRSVGDLFPKNPQSPMMMGLIYSRQNRKDEARQAFTRTLELAPGYLPAVEKIVELDLLDKQYAAATVRVQEQIDKNPKAAEPWLLIAKIDVARAQELLDAENAKNTSPSIPKLPFSAVPAAQAFLNQAETAVLKAIELEPERGASYVLLAELYKAANKGEQVLQRLNGRVAKTNDVMVLMQIGIIQESLTNYPAARDAYERLLKISPKFIAALNNLAYIYTEPLKDFDKAYPLAVKARQTSPYDPFTADTLGWILFKREEYPRALGLIQDSATRLPDLPDVQYHLGMAYYMLGEEDAARVALRKAADSPKDFFGKEEARQCLDILAVDVKTANAANVAQLEKHLAGNPNDPVTAAKLAAIQERDGQTEKAAQTYQAALKYNPKNPQLIFKLAQLYADRLNQTQKALDLAKSAHTLSPDDGRISSLLGRLVYQTGGDLKWSASLLEESALKNPDDPQIPYDLAWCYYSLGRLTDAEASMQTATRAEKFPRAEDARRFLLMVPAAGNAQQAQQVFPEAEKALRTDPNYVPALMISSAVQEGKGNYQQAAQVYHQILGHIPSFAPATRNLAILYFNYLQDDQKAYDLAAQARPAFPRDSEIARILGILAYRRSDYARASQLLKESAQNRKGDAELFYYLGMAQYKLKAKPECKAALQQSLALNLPAKLADDARRVLAELK